MATLPRVSPYSGPDWAVKITPLPYGLKEYSAAPGQFTLRRLRENLPSARIDLPRMPVGLA
ncbi:MAG: hypothetical protein H6651_04195 [Ardenticatenales bacterium]|nr:hypothetical protein [Ardenticatenales bacterium]